MNNQLEWMYNDSAMLKLRY